MILNKKYNTTDFKIAATELKIHPKSDIILKKAKRISKELGIYSDAFYSGHHTMTPYIFIDADIERSIIITVWFSTLYFLDDFFGEDMKNEEPIPDLKALFSAWKGSNYDVINLPVKFKPLFEAVSYCSKHIKLNSNKAFFKIYTEKLYQHILHTLNPIDYRTVDEYIESRIHFGGMYPTMGMIEYANNIYLDEHLFAKCTALEQVIKDCALIGVLSNDLISYHKEKHSQQNLLNAYLKTNTVSNLDEAIDRGLKYVNKCFNSFVKHSNAVKEQMKALSLTEKHTVNTYLKGLELLIAASYHWQMSTNRYRSIENIFENLRYPIDENI